MKLRLKKWILRITVTAVFIAGILVVIVLNPILLYAGKTQVSDYVVYHNQPLEPMLQQRLNNATQLIKASELYDPALHPDICLNDGSKYPVLMQTIRGRAFAWGFYNKVVLMAHADFKNNMAELNGYNWNLTELLAHEMIHCYQFNSLGLWHSNPVARIPEWKWEGYPEYVSRRQRNQQDLSGDVLILRKTEASDNNGWISFADSTGTVIPYYKSWLLVRYCLDVKRMSYKDLLADTNSGERIYEEMVRWARQ